MTYFSIGKKSTDHFNKNDYNVIDSRDELFNELTFETSIFFNDEYL